MKTLLQRLGYAAFVAAVVAILLPVGVKAAQAISVYITDPIDGTHVARVTVSLTAVGYVQ
jgi:hypothetical protein